MSNMFQISNIHNAALESLLTALITQLPVEPIKNLKKLLEIYQEVLYTNAGDIKQELGPLLGGWKASTSLKKVIVGIEERLSVASQGTQS
jgi:hypothetical protein